MNEEKLMKIIARLEGKIMDLEEELDATRNGEFWYEQARKGMNKDDA